MLTEFGERNDSLSEVNRRNKSDIHVALVFSEKELEKEQYLNSRSFRFCVISRFQMNKWILKIGPTGVTHLEI